MKDEGRAEHVAAVRAVFPNATAMSDYDYEHAWSCVYTGNDGNGMVEGNMLASGATQEEAWKNAAENVSICGICGGTGAVDSGGFTPWGEGIDVGCGHCNGTGKEPA